MYEMPVSADCTSLCSEKQLSIYITYNIISVHTFLFIYLLFY